MIAALLDHLWQSTLFAGFVALLVPLLRTNRAAIRYGLWLTASVKFLLPFSLLANLGAALPAPVHPVLPLPALMAIRPAAVPFAHVVPPAAHHPTCGLLLLCAWALGLALVLAVWLARWLRLRGAMQGAADMPLSLPVPVRCVASWLEPGLVGIVRPVILMPRGIGEKLSATELNAILAHELCHLRRRDNLTAAIHMLVEALFWFHPLTWWIGRRLVEERELACDESVLADGNNPRAYAEGILKVCRFYIQSPLACASGVSGADLQMRIRAIMTARTAADLESGKGLLLALAALAALALPLAGGMTASTPMTMLARKVAHSLATPQVLPALLAPAQTFSQAPPRHRITARKAAAPTIAPVPAPQPVPMIAPAPVTLPAVMTIEAVRVVPLPAATGAGDTLVCRRPQQLAGSRFLGPRVCLHQSEWQALADQGKDVAPDGRTLIDLAAFERDRSLNAPSCRQAVMGAGASTAGTTNFVSCF